MLDGSLKIKCFKKESFKMDLFFTLNLIYWDFEEVSTQSMITIADRYKSSKLEILRVYLAATLRNCCRSSWNLFF